jgi:hypothetical protein
MKPITLITFKGEVAVQGRIEFVEQMHGDAPYFYPDSWARLPTLKPPSGFNNGESIALINSEDDPLEETLRKADASNAPQSIVIDRFSTGDVTASAKVMRFE